MFEFLYASKVSLIQLLLTLALLPVPREYVAEFWISLLKYSSSVYMIVLDSPVS